MGTDKIGEAKNLWAVVLYRNACLEPSPSSMYPRGLMPCEYWSGSTTEKLSAGLLSGFPMYIHTSEGRIKPCVFVLYIPEVSWPPKMCGMGSAPCGEFSSHPLLSIK
jgi:hypothetical protein